MWEQLGWFSVLVCAGSVAGVVTWVANIQFGALNYEGNALGVTARQSFTLFASSNRWFTVFYIFYPVEFLCLIMAKVMLLGRLSNHASHNYNSQERHWDDGVGYCDCIGEYALEKLHRIISKAVALASVAGVLALVVAAAYNVKLAGVTDDRAAAACGAQGNASNVCNTLKNDFTNFINIAEDAAAVQSVLEAIVLVVMCAAYMVFIPVCVFMFGRAERRLIRILGYIEYKLDHTSVELPAQYSPQAADGVSGAAADAHIQMRCDNAKELLRATLAEATAQRRRFVAACAIVLVTFFLRASFDLLRAYSRLNVQYNPLCHACDPCQMDQVLIGTWLFYTPEFQAIVVALSSPLPLAVSLWLMMTKEDRMLLWSPNANETEQLLPERNNVEMVVASRKNMAIDLL
jgi:hypothetical protein